MVPRAGAGGADRFYLNTVQILGAARELTAEDTIYLLRHWWNIPLFYRTTGAAG
jgi:hypothetical protein